jgi:hypothetical protein
MGEIRSLNTIKLSIIPVNLNSSQFAKPNPFLHASMNYTVYIIYTSLRGIVYYFAQILKRRKRMRAYKAGEIPFSEIQDI